MLKLNFPAALHCMSVLKLFQLLIINFIMLFIEGMTLVGVAYPGQTLGEVGSYGINILTINDD